MTIHTAWFMIKRRLRNYYYKYYIIPKKYNSIHKKLSNIHIKSILDTARELLCTNKSLSRFGDGEFKWLFGVKNTHSFQKSSKALSSALFNVLTTNNKNLMIGLPDGLTNNRLFVTGTNFFWQQFCSKYGNKIFPLLSKNKQYYNTSVSRPYIDYNTRDLAKETFSLWKKIWSNKNLLIIEGTGSRLGYNDSLFNNVCEIKRIECPPLNAFNSCSSILNATLNFLNKSNKTYMILISLGPTATILSAILCQKGFRAIDIGHIDLEYEWYVKGVKEKINLPYKYVNEVPYGNSALPILDKKYKDEIICRITSSKIRG